MRFITIFVLFLSVNAQAQWKDYIINAKGDTLNRVDMNGKKQGPWVIHVDDLRGERGFDEQGYFDNDKREGTWKKFSLDGDLIAVENYKWGNKHGKSQYYTNMGDLLREESWKSVNPEDPYDTVPVYDVDDPTKVVRTEIVKLEGTSLKHGTWKYYDPNFGAVVKTEKYFNDRPAAGDPKNEDDLRPIEITDNAAAKPALSDSAKKALPKPQAILDYEKKNSGKKKVKVRDGRTGY